MAIISSPGVSISLDDQSQYGSSGQGTVPLIILATQSNKSNVSATGYASGTVAANAGKLTLLSSQRELVEQFGRPYFKVVDGTPIHGAETNEYGLLTAYSYLGIANRAYVLRADIDLAQIYTNKEVAKEHMKLLDDCACAGDHHALAHRLHRSNMFSQPQMVKIFQ